MSVTDRFPNYLSGSLTLSAANTFTTEVENLPIVRPTAGRGRSTIMEFLWIDIALRNDDFIDVDDSAFFVVSTGTAPTSSTQVLLDSGNVIAFFNEKLAGQTSGIPVMSYPQRIDLQDKNGYGQLVATDRINISAGSSGMAAAINWRYRIYYRYVTVGAEEYIGIVQSQLGTA